MENKHPISEILQQSLSSLKQLVDVNTIVGEPVNAANGTTIIPISKVTFGYCTGGSEWPTAKPNTPFGGGSGAGVTIQPLCFLVVASDGNVQLLQIQTADTTADRVVNMFPGFLDTVSGLIQKKPAKTPPEEDASR